MLALNSAQKQIPKTTPNLLPCTINHNGPIRTSPRHWSPTPSTDRDGTSTSYFRGRKLLARHVRLPAGYEGLVLQKSDSTLPTQRQEGGDMAEKLRRMEEGDDDEEMDDAMGADGYIAGKEVEVKIMETKARFDEVVVWGHEQVPEDDDVYVKGVEEWVGFAEAMHSYDPPPK